MEKPTLSQEERERWRREHADQLDKAQHTPDMEVGSGGAMMPPEEVDENELEARRAA